MRPCRLLVVTVLMHLVIDAAAVELSWAFVIDPDNSVEALQASGVGRAVHRRIATAPSDTPIVRLRSRNDSTDRTSLTATASPENPRSGNGHFRPKFDPSPSFEDPL